MPVIVTVTVPVEAVLLAASLNVLVAVAGLGLNEAVTAFDARGAAALEGRFSADDTPSPSDGSKPHWVGAGSLPARPREQPCQAPPENLRGW